MATYQINHSEPIDECTVKKLHTLGIVDNADNVGVLGSPNNAIVGKVR
jgi:hypothetical protein